MGGPGSGRRPQANRGCNRLVADRDVLRLDIRELYPDGLLNPDAQASITWRRHGRVVASIDTFFDPCRSELRLSYTHTHPVSGPERRLERIRMAYSACNFGAYRPWFLCPGCGMRCAVLWGLARFRCRRCLKVKYASQNEALASRAMRRIHELRAKLGVQPSVPVSEIARPRYMRHDRYRRLMSELFGYEALRSAWLSQLSGRDAAFVEPDFEFEESFEFEAAEAA